MKKRNILAIAFAVVSFALAVVAYLVLPDFVVVQFSVGSAGNSMVPKLLAIIIMLSFGIGGAILSVAIKDNQTASNKSLIVSAVGVLLGIFMIIVNCR